MGELKEFLLSLMAASAGSAILELLLSERGGMKKYLRYIVSLVLLLTLLSPLLPVLGSLGELATLEVGGYSSSYDEVEALARANSIVALHIKRAVCEHFDLGSEEASVKLDGDGVRISVRRRLGLLADDIAEYVMRNFGVVAEVELYERG